MQCKTENTRIVFHCFISFCPFGVSSLWLWKINWYKKCTEQQVVRLTMYLSGYIGWTEKLVLVYFMSEMSERISYIHTYTISIIHPSICKPQLLLYLHHIIRCLYLAHSCSETEWKFIDLVSVHKFVTNIEHGQTIRGHFFSFRLAKFSNSPIIRNCIVK